MEITVNQRSALEAFLHDLLPHSRADRDELERRIRRAELDAAAAAVLARATDPTVRSVLHLHRPVTDTSAAMPVCQGCDSYDGPDAEPPEWPCRTWTLIQQQLNL